MRFLRQRRSHAGEVRPSRSRLSTSAPRRHFSLASALRVSRSGLASSETIVGTRLLGPASWVLPLGVVFFVSPKLLHLLGAERFGVLMIALVTPLIASQLDFGITSAAVRGSPGA